MDAPIQIALKIRKSLKVKRFRDCHTVRKITCGHRLSEREQSMINSSTSAYTPVHGSFPVSEPEVSTSYSSFDEYYQAVIEPWVATLEPGSERSDAWVAIERIKEAYENQRASIDLSNCPNLTTLPEGLEQGWPVTLEQIKMDFDADKPIAANTWKAYANLFLQGWLESAPFTIERSMREDIFGRIQQASDQKSKTVDLSFIPITTLPPMGHLIDVNILILRGCDTLERLPPRCLPPNLTKIDCSGCSRLSELGRLPPIEQTVPPQGGAENLALHQETGPVRPSDLSPPASQRVAHDVPHAPPLQTQEVAPSKEVYDVAPMGISYNSEIVHGEAQSTVPIVGATASHTIEPTEARQPGTGSYRQVVIDVTKEWLNGAPDDQVRVQRQRMVDQLCDISPPPPARDRQRFYAIGSDWVKENAISKNEANNNYVKVFDIAQFIPTGWEDAPSAKTDYEIVTEAGRQWVEVAHSDEERIERQNNVDGLSKVAMRTSSDRYRFSRGAATWMDDARITPKEKNDRIVAISQILSYTEDDSKYYE